MIIKIDSKFFEALATYLHQLSNNRITQAKVLHAKVESLEDFGDRIRCCVETQGILGEAKAYDKSAEEIEKLIEELKEKFAVNEEEGS